MNQATQDKTETVTFADGNFTFPVLLPGSYSVQVDTQGFQSARQTGIAINAGDHLRLPTIALTVGSAWQTVTIEAVSQILETDNGQRGAVLDSKDIENLALESRNGPSY